MHETQHILIATAAARLLREDLLPIAIQAAGLPPDTRLEDLLSLACPDAFSDLGEEAKALCRELLLPGASGIAARLDESEPAEQIHRCILGLIWRDAHDCAIARDRALLSNVAGFDNAEFEADYAHELAIQQRWQASNHEVRRAFDAFLAHCTDLMQD